MLKTLLENKKGIDREIINHLKPIIKACFSDNLIKVNYIDDYSIEVFLENKNYALYNIVLPIAACETQQSFQQWMKDMNING